MSQTFAADDEDASPLTSGYPAGKIALAIVLAAALHGVLLGSSLLIGPKKPAETAAKGTTTPIVGTNTNGKTGTDTATGAATTDKKADEPKSSAAPKGDPGEDLKLDEK